MNPIQFLSLKFYSISFYSTPSRVESPYQYRTQWDLCLCFHAFHMNRVWNLVHCGWGRRHTLSKEQLLAVLVCTDQLWLPRALFLENLVTVTSLF